MQDTDIPNAEIEEVNDANNFRVIECVRANKRKKVLQVQQDIISTMIHNDPLLWPFQKCVF